MSVSGVEQRQYYRDGVSNTFAGSNAPMGQTMMAASEPAPENGNPVLGIAMARERGSNMSYGISARYAPGSTPENPVIQVTSNYNGTSVDYYVNIKEINPKDATQLQMFALCCYTDDVGLTQGGTFGTYQKLKVFGENADLNGYCDSMEGWDTFTEKTFDWEKITMSVMSDYLKAGIYDQYQDGKKLLTMFEAVSQEGQAPSSEQLWQSIQDKIEEITKKLESGDTQEGILIGGRAYTEEEWNELLENFDSVQETIRELMKEEQEKKEQEEIQKAQQKSPAEKDAAQLLLTDSTTCTYPSADPEEEPVMYITWYTSEGIFCRKEGMKEGYLWSISFDDPSQYRKAMEFLNAFDSEDNLRFASSEEFWRKFLADEIDQEDFMAFYQTTNHGIPNYGITVGDSTYIDEEKIAYAPYFNGPIGRMYTGEEMLAKIRAEVEKNAEILRQQQLTPNEMYRKTVAPRYRGERIFCEYLGGPLYSADEMADKMMENLNNPHYK